ncbi:unnamed protein product [Cochlearia groenlandica]
MEHNSREEVMLIEKNKENEYPLNPTLDDMRVAKANSGNKGLIVAKGNVQELNRMKEKRVGGRKTGQLNGPKVIANMPMRGLIFGLAKKEVERIHERPPCMESNVQGVSRHQHQEGNVENIHMVLEKGSRDETMTTRGDQPKDGAGEAAA